MTLAIDPAAVEMPPPAARAWTRERIVGHVLVGLWLVAGATLAFYLVSAWNPELFDRWMWPYISGLGTTLQLVFISIVIGALLSIPIAYARMSRHPILGPLAFAYVYFFRGTPLLAQTFLIYYGLGSFRPALESVGLWVFFREAWYCAVLAFSL